MEDLRRLSPSDFSAEQVASWVSAGAGCEAAPAAPKQEAAKADWFVAYTNPRREADVVRACKRRQVQAYMPAMTVTRRRAEVSRPLFPRYVFVGLPAERSLYDLRETPGLEGVVRTGGELARLGADCVEGLIAQEADGVFDFTARRWAEEAAAKAQAASAWKLMRVQPGMQVRIVGGPWYSFRGVVESLHLPDRISVFMKMFGRSFPVPMLLADVEPV